MLIHGPRRLLDLSLALPVQLLLLVLLLVAAGCASDADEPIPSAAADSTALLPPATTAPIAMPDEPQPAPATPGDDLVQDATTGATQPPDVLETTSELSCLSVRQRIGQLLIPLAVQSDLASAQSFAGAGEIGGIALLGSPDSNLSSELAALQAAALVPIVVASDEEGGSVQRLDQLLGPLPSAAATAQSGQSLEEVRQVWLDYGTRLRQNGVTMVFGPVVDVGSGPGIESRSFSDDPQTVTAYGRAVASGLLDAGIIPVFKHFPGHGRASADSHLELPVTPPFEEMRTYDLVPYTELLADPRFADGAGVMVGHLAVPGLSDDRPTSLSPEAVTDVLRGELSFSGLIITDAMNMGAIVNTYGQLESLELALIAGADMLIVGSLADVTPALDALSARAEADPAFAELIDDRAGRVVAAKAQSAICGG